MALRAQYYVNASLEVVHTYYPWLDLTEELLPAHVLMPPIDTILHFPEPFLT